MAGSEQENTVHVQINYRRLCKDKKLLQSLGEKSPSILNKLGKGRGSGEQSHHQQQHKSPGSTTTSTLSTFHQLSLSSSPHNKRVVSKRQGSTFTLSSTSPDFSGSTDRSHSSLGHHSAEVGERSPQLVSAERSRSLSPVAREDLYSYKRSPLPKHRTPPSVSPLTHDSTHQTGSSCQTEGHVKVLMNGHTQHLEQSGQTHNSFRRTSDRKVTQGEHEGSSANLASSGCLASSLTVINHSPSSSPEAEDSAQTSEQVQRSHKSVLTKHHYSSYPNFFNTSKESATSDAGGRGVNFMKPSGGHDSMLSLWDVASTSTTVTQGGEDCAQWEAAVMDLYILKQSSDFYHQLCFSWVNVKIVSVPCHTVRQC